MNFQSSPGCPPNVSLPPNHPQDLKQLTKTKPSRVRHASTVCWLLAILGVVFLGIIQSVNLFSGIDLTQQTPEVALKLRDGVAQSKGDDLKHSFVKNGTMAKEWDPGSNATFCVDWDTNMDVWWTHEPEWTVSSENETHQCFSRVENEEKRSLFRKLYNIQFKGNCSHSATYEMWSTGWGADFLKVNDGLNYALETEKPVQIWSGENGWHYAAKKDGSSPACPTMDMSCYFLNISSCSPRPDGLLQPRYHKGQFLVEDSSKLDLKGQHGQWLYEYATRTQTWLRRAIQDYAKAFPIRTPCTVMHVRRADVVLHYESSRKYHAISEYVDAGISENASNILLLTDDANAVEEALSQYPQHNWMYIDRARYKGADGGWEAHFPSDDPKQETIVILSIFRRLAPQCTTLIHSNSNFADLIYFQMQGSKRINIDDGKNNDDIYSETNSMTTNVSLASSSANLSSTTGL